MHISTADVDVSFFLRSVSKVVDIQEKDRLKSVKGILEMQLFP